MKHIYSKYIVWALLWNVIKSDDLNVYVVGCNWIDNGLKLSLLKEKNTFKNEENTLISPGMYNSN